MKNIAFFIIAGFLLFTSCKQPLTPSQITITIKAIKKDTENPLSEADVFLKTQPDYIYRTTNSSGECIFSGIDVTFKLHLEIVKDEDSLHYYHWNSITNGYPDGISFGSLPDNRFEVEAPNIIGNE